FGRKMYWTTCVCPASSPNSESYTARQETGTDHIRNIASQTFSRHCRRTGGRADGRRDERGRASPGALKPSFQWCVAKGGPHEKDVAIRLACCGMRGRRESDSQQSAPSHP